MRAAFVIFASAGLYAVVDLFNPLMPHTLRVVLVVVLFPLMLAEFLTIGGVLITGNAEGVEIGRHSIPREEAGPLRIAVVAMFVMVVALSLVHAAWLSDEFQPFVALWLAWMGGWAVRRVLGHRRHIEVLAASIKPSL